MYKPLQSIRPRAFFLTSLFLIFFSCFLLNVTKAASKTNTVPKLTGMSLSKAKRIASQLGLTLSINPVPTSMGSLRYKTIRQQPRPGSRIWDRKKPIQLWYYDTKARDHYSNSKKPKNIQSSPQKKDNRVKVPDVMGLMLYQAQTKAWRMGLDMAVLNHVSTHEKSLDGTIAFQEPMPGVKVSRGSLITVWTYKTSYDTPGPRIRK